jgi:hypothetical protein
MILIDPSYEQYATVRWGYNAPFIVVGEYGEGSLWLTRSAARRLHEVLPGLIDDLDRETDRALDV